MHWPKRAIDHGVNLLPVAKSLFAEGFKLNAWLDQQGVPPPLLGVNRAGSTEVQKAMYSPTQQVRVNIKAQQEAPKPVEKTESRANLALEAFLVPVPTPEQEVPLTEIQLSQTRTMTVGRQVGVYLFIDHTSVSRRHAEISYANGQYVLQDLGSTNGTFINESRLESGNVYVLTKGDLVRFGKLVKYSFQVRAINTQQKAMSSAGLSQAGLVPLQQLPTDYLAAVAPSGQAALQAAQPVLNNDGSLMLPGIARAVPADIVAQMKMAPALILIRNGKPEVYFLKGKQPITLGREPENEIVLDDPVISRKHAEIFPAPDGYYIRDLRSSNGVFLNQARIDNLYRLTHGDHILLGSVLIYFIDVSGRSGQQR